MQLRARLRSPGAIPTSSMADIAFLLIIFFMLTAVFVTTRGLQFRFPKDDPTQVDVQPEEAIHIKIMGEGQYMVDKTPMSLEEMGGYIQMKMDQNPQKPVIIQTQPDVPYFVMIDVFDRLKYLQVEHISIPTRTEVERWKAFGIFE
ncbi:biopolymer transporter ExbD [Acidobacteria bacterium AH-259-O06]|nr:biopolymer transporter ExbD [Acidobacteria bacterium AH-259-G07]MDA2928438.1 biopolymer transporter ExbD [Acidobacteria bacterium AH-259-O06]